MPNGVPSILGIPILGAGTLPQIMQQASQARQVAQQRAAQTQLAQAQAKLAGARAASGLPGGFAPGGAGIIQGEDLVKKEYGENSPEFQRVKAWNDTVNFEKNSRGNYYQANLLLKNIPTPQKQQLILQIQKDTGKPVAEIESELSGSSLGQPVSANPMTSPVSNTVDNPGSQASAIHNTYFPSDQEKQENQQQVAQTEAQLAKETGNTAAQKQLPPLLDIAKTLNQVDFTPVANFAGIHGKTYATMERAKAAMGLPVSPEFKAYDNFTQSEGKLLADSARQALQTSVRNEYVKHMIMPLTNTSVWYENPELAMNRFNFFRNWLNDRMKMYQTLATKGVSPNAEEFDKTLGIGKPPQQSVQSEASTLTTKQLMKIARGQQDGG